MAVATATAAKKPVPASAKPAAPKPSTSAANKKMFEDYQAKNQSGGTYNKNGSGDGVGSGRKSLSELKAMAREAARDAANLRRQESDYNQRSEAVRRQNEFTMQSNLMRDQARYQQEAQERSQRNTGVGSAYYTSQQTERENAQRRADSEAAKNRALQERAINANRPLLTNKQGMSGNNAGPGGYNHAAAAVDRANQAYEQRESQKNAIQGQKDLANTQIEGQSRLQSERANQAKDAANQTGEFQSRLQRERSEQGLQSQREGVDGQSRLQSERSNQSLISQREAAATAMERAKFDVEGRSRLQREGSDQGRIAQQERAEQGLRSQREGVEGQSRLQRERSEQAGKLQSQASAEAAARSAGNRAAAIASFRNFGKGR